MGLTLVIVISDAVIATLLIYYKLTDKQKDDKFCLDKTGEQVI